MKSLRDIAAHMHRSEADARARRHIMNAADRLAGGKHDQAIEELLDALTILRSTQRQAAALELKEART